MATREPTYITTLNKFIDWVEELKEPREQLNPGKYLFRGLSNKKHSIEASAWRRLTDEENRSNLEKFLEMNTGLIRDARLYEHDRKNGRELSDLEILAELQHFRAATCLIDFTYSAQVALWFACQSNSHGTVGAVLDNTDKIREITSELLVQEIDYFFEADAEGVYPLYRWQPRQLNNRIFPQYSVFLFGGDRIIEPDVECIIEANSKQKILDSLEDFSQLTEATLFPDFDGFVRQRTQDRPYDVPNYEQSGYRAYERGEYHKAIAYYDQAINLNPNDVGSYKLRGDANHRLGQYKAAITDFDEAIILNPSDGHAYKLRGDVKMSLNQLDEARDDLRKALQLAQQAGDTLLITAIEPTLREVEPRVAKDKQWTPERFRRLVPKALRDLYEVRNRDGELYNLWADLQDSFHNQGWELRPRFGVKHIFFFAGDIRLFGINLFSSRPRLTFCRTTEEEARSIVPQYNFTSYPQYSQLVCHRGPTVEDLQPLFEFVYRKHIMRLWEDQKIVDALKHILEDYDYLEYDEVASKRTNGLRVEVTRLDADRDFSVTGHICRALEQAIGRRFFVPGVVTHGSQNWEKEWTFFTVREQ